MDDHSGRITIIASSTMVHHRVRCMICDRPVDHRVVFMTNDARVLHAGCVPDHVKVPHGRPRSRPSAASSAWSTAPARNARPALGPGHRPGPRRTAQPDGSAVTGRQAGAGRGPRLGVVAGLDEVHDVPHRLVQGDEVALGAVAVAERDAVLGHVLLPGQQHERDLGPLGLADLALHPVVGAVDLDPDALGRAGARPAPPGRAPGRPRWGWPPPGPGPARPGRPRRSAPPGSRRTARSTRTTPGGS